MPRNADMQPYPGECDGEDFAPGRAYDSEPAKPVVKLVGENGNAFAILGLAIRAARKAGWSQEQIDEYKGKATSGDYGNLLSWRCLTFTKAAVGPTIRIAQLRVRGQRMMCSYA